MSIFKENFKKTILNLIIILVIFLTDRISKIYIIKIAEVESVVDIYLNSYLNYSITINGVPIRFSSMVTPKPISFEACILPSFLCGDPSE